MRPGVGGLATVDRQTLGALLESGLLPVEAVFWYGFGLPIPPLLAIVRVVLTALAWQGLV